MPKCQTCLRVDRRPVIGSHSLRVVPDSFLRTAILNAAASSRSSCRCKNASVTVSCGASSSLQSRQRLAMGAVNGPTLRGPYGLNVRLWLLSSHSVDPPSPSKRDKLVRKFSLCARHSEGSLRRGQPEGILNVTRALTPGTRRRWRSGTESSLSALVRVPHNSPKTRCCREGQ